MRRWWQLFRGFDLDLLRDLGLGLFCWLLRLRVHAVAGESLVSLSLKNGQLVEQFLDLVVFGLGGVLGLLQLVLEFGDLGLELIPFLDHGLKLLPDFQKLIPLIYRLLLLPLKTLRLLQFVSERLHLQLVDLVLKFKLLFH